MVENVPVVEVDNENEIELLYEVNLRGQRMLVRSVEANQRAFLRFTNKTAGCVDIFWRDYQGIQRFYVKIEPGQHYDVNSYITHPWEFKDSYTKEHYVINNRIVFYPPRRIGGMMYRTNWNITRPLVRTLRATALLALRKHYTNPEEVYNLGLPITLANELSDIITQIERQKMQEAQ